MKKIISIIMALAMLVTPVNITSVKADQIYNIEKSSQSQITENKIEKLISSQKADIRTGKVKIENKKLESISLPRANYGTINQAATTLKKAMLAHQSTLYVLVKSKSSAADQIYYDIEDKAASVTDNLLRETICFGILVAEMFLIGLRRATDTICISFL